MERRLVVVMGRNYTSRLGMIRAAGGSGCDVAVIQTDRVKQKLLKPVDSFSKYVTGGYFYSPQPDTERLIDLLLKNFSGREEKPVLLPTDDYTASAVDLNMDRLREKFVFPGVDGRQGKAVYFMDKGIQKELARKAGFNVAEGWTAVWENGKYHIPEGVVFPCFIKPEISYINSGKQTMRKCGSKEELAAALEQCGGKEGYPILIEQFIDVEQEYDIPGLALKEKTVIPGMIKKGEIFLGVTATGEMQSMDEYPGIREAVERLMREIGFTGLIDIELFGSHGKIYFNELNMRFGASGFAMTGSGINLPGMFIRCLEGSCKDGCASLPKGFSKVFASEKVLLSLLAARKISLKGYFGYLDSSDFSFVRSNSDRGPYAALRILEILTVLRLLKKKILHR